MNTITTAAREYASRPADERFPSVEALTVHAEHEKALSKEVTYNAKDLRARVSLTHLSTSTSTPHYGTDPQTGKSVAPVMDAAGSIVLESPKGCARFTHWSFSQLCRSIGAPAAYLRSLHPSVAVDAINEGLTHTPPSTDIKMLVRAPNGKPEPVIRACTSDSYGRVWDADIYRAVAREIMQDDDRWSLPPTWSGEAAGAYRGDRDSFLILTNGGSIVTDPSLASAPTPQRAYGPNSSDISAKSAGQDQMYRGILIRNSEVGASSVVIDTILYRYICGNHMLWGAVYDKRFKRRHVGTHVTRDVIREISRIAANWARQSPERDVEIIKTLIANEIAHTKEAVIDELKAVGCTEAQAEAAYLRCEETESVSPRSFWGAAQGITRISQDASHQDARYLLDQIAAKVLAKGARLVPA